MRILQVVHNFPPYSWAGTEVYTRNLARELAKRHEVHVLYPAPTGKGIAEAMDGEVALHELPTDRWHILRHAMSIRTHCTDAHVERAFEALLDGVRPDVVHFQHLERMCASLIEIARAKHVRVVITLHDFWFMCPRVQLLRPDLTLCEGPDPDGKLCAACWRVGGALRRVAGSVFIRARQVRERGECMRRALLGADVIISPSMFLKRMFVMWGVPEERIVFSENGMDLSSFEGFERVPSEHMRVGYVGGIAPHKGVHVLLDAFERISDERIVLNIYGRIDSSNPYHREVMRRAEHDPRISLFGAFDDVREPYSNIDVLVLPSIWYENCPLTIHEAYITRTPVIASNIGGMAEYVHHGKTGLLFEMGDAADLARKIEQLAQSARLLEQLREGIGEVKSIEQQAIELERLYETG